MTEVQLWGGDANWWQAHVPLRHHVKMENGEDAAQHNLHDSHQGLPWSCTECANPTSPDCSHTLQKKVHLLEAELKAIRCERAAGWSAAVDALKAFTAERHAWDAERSALRAEAEAAQALVNNLQECNALRK